MPVNWLTMWLESWEEMSDCRFAAYVEIILPASKYLLE
jgi:hypothetical protein